MPGFKIKNLMVDVVGAKAAQIEKLCAPKTMCTAFSIPCMKILSPAPPPTINCCHYIFSHYQCHYIISHDPCYPIRSIPCAGFSPGPEDPRTIVINDPDTLVIINVKEMLANPDLIKDVGNELDQVLKAVKERGAEIAKAMGTQTKEQAKFLEAELKEALNEVQKLKETLG